MDERWLLDPLAPYPPRPDELLAFGARSRRSDECVVWTGEIDCNGYGVAHYRGNSYPAHVLAFALTNGGLPPARWEVAQRCAVHACITPDHLYVRERAHA